MTPGSRRLLVLVVVGIVGIVVGKKRVDLEGLPTLVNMKRFGSFIANDLLFAMKEPDHYFENPVTSIVIYLVSVNMGDHFVFLVDRLLTESTLEAALESINPSKQPDPVSNEDTVIDCSSHDVFTPKKLVECRICQDEDFDLNMETPCSCCGSLKYAHRRCVQRWCNEKGDTICEICHQQFKPGYTAPSPVFRLGGIPLNFRGHWQIARRDMNNNPQIIAVVSPDRSFLDQEYDEYADSPSRSVFCFRSVAAIFVVLLFLRHALPVIANRAGSYSFAVFLASNASSSSLSSSDEGEASLTPSQNQPRVTRVD
ncbi:RING/FYVE/PHD zinc finger superfamily protein [Tanacetum coccineum]